MKSRLLTLLSLLMAVVLAGCAVKDPSNPRFVVAEGRGIKITRAQLDAEVNKALTNFNL